MSFIIQKKRKNVSNKDKSQLDYLQQLKSQKESVVRSQNDFEKLRDSMTEIVDYQYKGGSMRPFAINSYALELTVNQLKLLISISGEIMY